MGPHRRGGNNLDLAYKTLALQLSMVWMYMPPKGLKFTPNW